MTPTAMAAVQWQQREKACLPTIKLSMITSGPQRSYANSSCDIASMHTHTIKHHVDRAGTLSSASMYAGPADPLCAN